MVYIKDENIKGSLKLLHENCLIIDWNHLHLHCIGTDTDRKCRCVVGTTIK